MKILLNRILKIFGLTLIKAPSLQLIKSELDLKTELINSYTGQFSEEQNSAEGIIFSMDRALQLHSLLSSYYEKVKDPVKINILYRSTSPGHSAAYKEVFEIFKQKDLNIVEQKEKSSFKVQLVQILEQIKTKSIFYLVDDIVFIEDVIIKDCLKFDARDYIFSLRMGKNITSSYTANKKIQKQPNFKEEGNKLFWKWIPISAESDWEYPLSVDGHFFLSQEILSITKRLDFSSPNTYEPALYRYAELFKNRLGVSYTKSRIVNLPINKVQQDTNNQNRSGDIHQDFLLKKWNEGMQMDYRSLYGFKNNDTHQEIAINFIERG